MEAGQALEDALRTIALPGHSEHQTGLALDFNDVSGDFALTEAYRWLQEHGAEYGFIQRYPAGKESVTGIAEESWHYRYVGRPHAQAMKRLGERAELSRRFLLPSPSTCDIISCIVTRPGLGGGL